NVDSTILRSTLIERRYRRRLFAAWTWRGLGRFLFWFRGGIFLLRRARRRRSGRLLRGGRGRVLWSGQFCALLQPLLIIFRRIDNHGPLHSVMAETTELAANNFVRASFDRLEPHRNERTRNR